MIINSCYEWLYNGRCLPNIIRSVAPRVELAEIRPHVCTHTPVLNLSWLQRHFNVLYRNFVFYFVAGTAGSFTQSEQQYWMEWKAMTSIGSNIRIHLCAYTPCSPNYRNQLKGKQLCVCMWRTCMQAWTKKEGNGHHRITFYTLSGTHFSATWFQVGRLLGSFESVDYHAGYGISIECPTKLFFCCCYIILQDCVSILCVCQPQYIPCWQLSGTVCHPPLFLSSFVFWITIYSHIKSHNRQPMCVS